MAAMNTDENVIVAPPPPSFKDPSSLSNPAEVFTDHIHLTWKLDLVARKIRGAVRYTFRIVAPEAKSVTLDIRGIHVSTVVDARGTALKHTVKEDVTPIGGALTVQLPERAAGDQSVDVEVRYETDGCGGGSAAGGACDWLDAAQTNDGKPYLFTQAQAVHARSLLPCQDTPAVKASYSAVVTVDEPNEDLVVVMSAISQKLLPEDPKRAFRFLSKIPIPSYLIALACGQLESRDLSPRCRVWAEPSVVAKAAWEFEEVESFLTVAERLAGPYVWGRYDLLVLPASFPYGGMENPALTFVTPTLLAGDRSLVSVVAHEVMHSWAGNLVTCQSWNHFWLNESFTVKLERRILSEMYGSGREGLDAVAGRQNLQDFVQSVGPDHKYTSLVSQLQDGEDPDDYFSIVPYEKGNHMLSWIEQCVVKDSDAFDAFVKDYFDHFKYQSITSERFVSFISDRFPEVTQAVDFEKWLHGTGMAPELAPQDLSDVNTAALLATTWISAMTDGLTGEAADVRKQHLRDRFGDSAETLSRWESKQMLCFLNKLMALLHTHNDETLGNMWNETVTDVFSSLYRMNETRNSEIRFIWCRLAILGKNNAGVENARTFVSEQGRMKFIRPLFSDLHNVHPKGSFAVELYEKVKDSYHVIARKMIARDLGVSAS